MDLLDNLDMINSRDPEGALDVAGDSASQLTWDAVIEQADNGDFRPTKIVLAGMGGSAQPGKLSRSWLQLQIPFEVVSDYALQKRLFRV